MNTYKKAMLLEEFVRSYTKNPNSTTDETYLNFLLYNDLGIPLSQAVVYNLAHLTEEGEAIVNDTWENFCSIVEIDPEKDYESIDEMMDDDE